MKLIVGLGNPGEKHEKSRHNIGFMVVETIAQMKNGKWKMDKKKNALISNINSELILIKPQTMMNASGYAVKRLMVEYRVSNIDLWIIHDDLDLPLGKIKITQGHGSAGHHGIDSIAEELGTNDFVRFRVGIGHPSKAGKQEVGSGELELDKAKRHDVVDFVLKDFEGKEAVEAEKVIIKTAKAVEYALENGLAKTSNKYNSK